VTPDVVATARGRIEVAEVGAGPAVLVVHGTPGDWQQARTLAEDLADRHRVLLPSRPGYGRTPLTTGRTPREQAEAYGALLDELGIGTSAVVGISGGGPSARSFAAHLRSRCSQLVLCCAVAEHLVTVPTATRLLGSVPAVWAVGARVAAVRTSRRLRDREAAHVQAHTGLGPAELALANDDPRVGADLLAFSRSRLRTMTSVTGLRNDFRQFHAAAEDEWPAGPDVPTLVLHGDHDEVVPLTHGEWARDSIPGAVLEVQQGAGHGFVLSMRRQVSPRIAEFLAAA
jgi:pimeloyl-ACP methyl ester carboxylesterase